MNTTNKKKNVTNQMNHKLLDKFCMIQKKGKKKKNRRQKIEKKDTNEIDFSSKFKLTFDLNCAFNLCTGNSKLNVFTKSLSRVEFLTSSQTSPRHSYSILIKLNHVNGEKTEKKEIMLLFVI